MLCTGVFVEAFLSSVYSFIKGRDMSQGVDHCKFFGKFWPSLGLFKNFKILIWGAIVAASFFIFFAKPAKAQPTYLAATYQINEPTVWTIEASPYIVQGWGVLQVNSVLNIEPGVVVKFRPDRFNLRYNGLKVNTGGRILAQGLSDNKIVFTSWYDDESVGDTNEDGVQTQPQAGDWLGLVFEADESILSYVDIFYAGANNGVALEIGQASLLKLDNSSITQSGGAGLFIQNQSNPFLNYLILQDNQGVGLESVLNDHSVTLSNSFINQNQGGALRLVADSSLFFVNVNFNNNNPQRIEIISKNINNDTIWQNLPGLYYESFLPGKHVIKFGITLTIEPGVNFKFAKTAGLYVLGNLKAEGSLAGSIIFTSSTDSLFNTPQPGDWGGIYAESGAQLILKYVNIKYGGLFQDDFNGVFYSFYSDYLISVQSAELIMANVSLGQSLNGGVFLQGESFGSIQNSLIFNMPRGLAISLNRSFVVSQNDFYDLSIFGLSVGQDSVSVDVRNNWWGSDSGPKIITNELGEGVIIVGNAIYEPWLRKVPVNNSPELVYQGGDGYKTDGLEPNIVFRTLSNLDFKVIYKDIDNEAPSFIRLVIGDKTYNLLAMDTGDYGLGRTFAVSLSSLDFLKGDYDYYFEASDGQADIRWPKQASLNFSVHNVPVVLVPGILGTELKKGDDVLWMNLHKVLFSATDSFMDPLLMKQDGEPVDSDVIIDDVIRNKTALGLVLIYSYFFSLIEKFESLGYIENQDLFVFPYDWRRDINVNAILLNSRLSGILNQTNSPKVNIIAHSMGGLVAKQAILLNEFNIVDKIIFLGTPHYGSPKAFKALLFGDSFGIPFDLLSPKQMKKLAQNMFSVYQLLPSQAYFSQAGSYYQSDSLYDYYQIKDFLLAAGLNAQALLAAEEWHSSGLEEINLANYGVRPYNIVGCGRPTISKIIRLNFPGLLKTILGDDQYALQLQDGDETVPLLSATGLIAPASNVFYAPGIGHSKLPSNQSIRTLVADIVFGSVLNNLPNNLSHDAGVCGVSGKLISVHSPVDISLYNSLGQHTGLLADGSFEQDMEEILFEEVQGNKFIFIPQGSLDYQIILTGTAKGSFDLRISDINNNLVTNTVYYSQIDITAGSRGSVNNLFSLNEPPTLFINNSNQDILITPSSLLNQDQLADYVAPVTTYQLNGFLNNQGYYQGGVELVLTAADNLAGSGILKIAYSLDQGATWQFYTKPLQFNNSGSKIVYYAAQDRAGNWEVSKQVEFIIIPTPAAVSGGIGSGGAVYNQPLVIKKAEQPFISKQFDVILNQPVKEEVKEKTINSQPQPKVQGVYKEKIDIFKNNNLVSPKRLVSVNDRTKILTDLKKVDYVLPLINNQPKGLFNKILDFLFNIFKPLILIFKK